MYGGLDLSARADLTALIWAAEDDAGVVHLLPRIWTPADTLAERALHDRAPYDAWVRSGELIAVPGTSVDYDHIAQVLGEDGATMNIVKLNYDRWRISILQQSLARFGVAVPLQECGQGFKDQAPCIEAFESLGVGRQDPPRRSPAAALVFRQSVVSRDAAANRKLDKARSYGRIDAAVAAVMAVGAMKASAEPAVEIAALIA